MVAERCGRLGAEAIDVAEIEQAGPVPGEDLGGGDVERAHVGKDEAGEPPLAGEDRGPGRGDR